MVSCPICGQSVKQSQINDHIDSSCTANLDIDPPPSSGPFQKNGPTFNFFKTPSIKRSTEIDTLPLSSPLHSQTPSLKRSFGDSNGQQNGPSKHEPEEAQQTQPESLLKRPKISALSRAAPLADRMRPKTLDEVYGQQLIGPTGVLRGLIEADRVPSMILWGGAGTGKTTIARVISSMVGSRFVEINSTSAGVADCKKIFSEARSELGLTGRKTILFCDEIHRFSKSQQDVFLGPVEAGVVTLIGATTENPSFKIQNALLSRCRTFTLSKLNDVDIVSILKRALASEHTETSIYASSQYLPPSDEATPENNHLAQQTSQSPLLSDELLHYLASFSDGDARTSLNLLELAIDLSVRPGMTLHNLKKSLTQTLVYDRAGDQHYDTISALHKSIRGGDPDAALYYLARMLQSGEDALYIARRLVVVASEDVGLADNTMLSLATATYTACEKIGMPECKINLGHCVVALSLSKKSTRVYRGLANASAALSEPGVAGLAIPIHLRNAPTRLMKEMGYGKEYKYNPDFMNGQVKQEYLPERLQDRRFLEDGDLGTRIDSDLEEDGEDVGTALLDDYDG